MPPFCIVLMVCLVIMVIIMLVAGGQLDFLGEELRVALAALGRITGRVDVEDVLDVLFADFCIGK